MTALQVQSSFGLLALCLLAWGMGGFNRGVSARVVVMGLALQIALGAALLHIAPLRAGFGYLGDAVNALAVAMEAGTSLVFGYLGGGTLPFQELRPGASFILFFQALPLVVVVGALSALFYHWGCQRRLKSDPGLWCPCHVNGGLYVCVRNGIGDPSIGQTR
jgi:CNT family concentrative nucleoside transporter